VGKVSQVVTGTHVQGVGQMTTYNKAYYDTPAGKAKQKRANQRLQNKRKLAWLWLAENRPDVIEEINNQLKKENNQ